MASEVAADGAIAIDVLGGGLILSLRLWQRGEDGAERGRTPHQLALADLSRTGLALFSMYSALIHFLAAEQQLALGVDEAPDEPGPFQLPAHAGRAAIGGAFKP